MAAVVSKSGVFSKSICHQNHQNESQIFPIRCSIPVRTRVGSSCLKSDFGGLTIDVDRNESSFWSRKRNFHSIEAKMGLSIGKAQRWWEKGFQPNMKEITSAQDLVDSLLTAGDKLVVLDFFSPGCGGCKALHPKIKKFKDALARYGPDRCTLGPPKGLEEKDLLALAANKDLSFTYTPKPVEEPVPVPQDIHAEVGTEQQAVSPSSNTKIPSTQETVRSSQDSKEKDLVTAGRRF